MTAPQAPGFTGSTLDRVDHLRENQAVLDTLRTDARARLLRLDGLDPILDHDDMLGWGSLAEASEGAELALLGLIDGTPRFVALDAVPPAARLSPGLWPLIERMPQDQAGIFAAARSLIDWHNRHRHCAQCGGTTYPIRAGWARGCNACDAQHFPRTDPVVIMLAEYKGRVLLGRQPQFPAGFYSALAGFLEVGESIEGAVIRELREEAGIDCSNVRYIASQPWPFPSSLMIACIASAASDAITLDYNELEAAIWCDRAEVAAALAGDPAAPFLGPPSVAIAHTLLSRWVAEG